MKSLFRTTRLAKSLKSLYEKNNFSKVFTNLVRYRSENNFIRPLKYVKLYISLKMGLVAKISKLSAAFNHYA